MKKIINLFIIVATLTIMVSGCNKALDKLNQDNNNFPSNVSPKNELPQVILSTATSIIGGDLAWYSSVYIEHSVGGSNQLLAADLRQTISNASILDNVWVNIYSSSLITGMDIIKKTKGTTDGYLEATARILVAYNLGLVADLWGDAPFKEAFNIGILQPKYDKAADLYDTVITYLTESIRLLNLTNQFALPKAEDYLYGGNTTKWEKAAHSLLARYYLRIATTKNANEYYQKALDEVALGFTSAADAMVFTKYTANQGEWNPWYDFLISRDYLATSNTLYKLMAPDDTRKQTMFSIPDGTGCLDNPVGNDLGSVSATYCISTYTKSGASPLPFMTYHELLFIKAECEQRLGSGTPLQSLKDAVTANFIWQGNTSAEAATYTGAIATSDIKTILTEKYIAQYPSEAIEAYNDYRRTKGEGVTMNNLLNSSATGGFPNFFPYPISEVSTNYSNVPQRSVTLSQPIWAR